MKKKIVFESQRELAAALGVSESHVSYMLKGKRSPSLKVVTKLAQLLGVSLDEAVRALNRGLYDYLDREGGE
jgi:transcriptional regulator with XRE-family HTH domain